MPASSRRTIAPESPEPQWLIVAGPIDLTILRRIERLVGRSITQAPIALKSHLIQRVCGNSECW